MSELAFRLLAPTALPDRTLVLTYPQSLANILYLGREAQGNRRPSRDGLWIEPKCQRGESRSLIKTGSPVLKGGE